MTDIEHLRELLKERESLREEWGEFTGDPIIGDQLSDIEDEIDELLYGD